MARSLIAVLIACTTGLAAGGCGSARATGVTTHEADAAYTTRSTFTCTDVADDITVRLALATLPAQQHTCPTITAGTSATACAAQLAACASAWGQTTGTVYANHPDTVDFSPAVGVLPWREAPGTWGPTAPVDLGDEPPVFDPGGPDDDYAGWQWELAATQAEIVDTRLHLTGSTGGITARFGRVFTKVFGLSLRGFAVVGGGAWSFDTVVGLGAALSFDFFWRQFLGNVDLVFPVGLGIWSPSVPQCGALGTMSAACHYNVGGSVGVRVLPTGGPSHARFSALEMGFDVWVGVSPEMLGLTVLPMVHIGFMSY